MIKIYAYYADDGPKGICGQSTSVTNPWRQLHIFEDYKTYKMWADDVALINNRIKPRVEYVWFDDEFTRGEIVTHESN